MKSRLIPTLVTGLLLAAPVALAQTVPDRQGPGPQDGMEMPGTASPQDPATTPPPAPYPQDGTMTAPPAAPGQDAAGSRPSDEIGLGTPPDTAADEARVLVEIEPAGSSTDAMGRTAVELLNRFSQLGYPEVQEFQRDGESYIAQATTPEGQQVTVVIDPLTGTIVQRP